MLLTSTMPESKPTDWKQELEIPGHVRFTEGTGDLPMIRVTTEWSTLDLYLHGAHVTHFQKKNEPPLLFLSKVSQFDAASPIRGGVPIILPWFGPRAGLPAHGFARRRPWDLRKIIPDRDGTIALHLRLSEDTGADGFPPFIADYVVTVRDTLSLQLDVTNKSATQDLVFEDCLHSYFQVGDINSASVTGLKGGRYLDNLEERKEKNETADAIRVSSEVDRVYVNTASPVEINDPSLHRTIRVEKENSASTVVWNPWIDKARQLADFGDDEYLRMICVESGNVAVNKITLPPGKASTLRVKLSSRT
jgi:glucose-6-phosphate 1-epimerase